MALSFTRLCALLLLLGAALAEKNDQPPALPSCTVRSVPNGCIQEAFWQKGYQHDCPTGQKAGICGRCLPWFTGGSFNKKTSREECACLCHMQGYTLAGVEDGDNCYCGKSESLNSTKMCGARADPPTCSKKCVANHSETCGGPNLVQLLEFTCTDTCGQPKPTPAPAPTPALPGLADVCAHLPATETRCSPEICSIAPGAHVQLEARTYYQDRALVLPAGARVIGAGINKTTIVNCGAPSTEMRGFILGNNTYVGNFTWQGHSPNRGAFSGAVQTPGCQGHDACDPKKCIPDGGDCAGAANVTAEHIHVLTYDDGEDWWPLVNDVAWFPKTLPWGPDRAVGSRNITMRGLISWGTWADGINVHGGHHNVLIEDCEISYTGDDPYGLWPASDQANKDRANCQRNIVLRNNIGRWPRQARGSDKVRIAAGHYGPRDFPDCADSPDKKRAGGGNWHCCFATYAGGSGVQFVNNRCEGAQGVVRFLAAYPFTVHDTLYCGTVAVAGNSYAEMPGQGAGCLLANNTDPNRWCEKTGFSGGAPAPEPPATIGGQCNASEPALPPRCPTATGRSDGFAACAQTPGVAGVCYNHDDEQMTGGAVRCVSGVELAELVEAGAGAPCKGFSSVCTLY